MTKIEKCNQSQLTRTEARRGNPDYRHAKPGLPTSRRRVMHPQITTPLLIGAVHNSDLTCVGGSDVTMRWNYSVSLFSLFLGTIKGSSAGLDWPFFYSFSDQLVEKQNTQVELPSI